MKKLPILTLLSLFLTSSAGAEPVVAEPGVEDPKAYFPGFSRPLLPDQSVGEVTAGQPIIWVVIDALRPDHLGCYGYERDTSPHLDKFADEGVIFTRFFANAPWTRPATTSMLTGRLPSGHGVECTRHKLPAAVGTVAEELKKAGYTTLAVVGNGNASSAFGLDKGFDVYEDTTRNWKGLPRARQVFDLGVELLKKHKSKKKVFLFLFVLDTHDPYRPPPPYEEMFLPGYKGKVVRRPAWEYKNNYPEPVKKKIIAMYDGLIRFTDDQIAEFFGKLKELGFWEESSIFVTADHGEALGEHGVYKHSYHHYDTHIRIPLLVRAPWLRARGHYSPAFLQQIDLAPTFVELAGGIKPESMEGISIVEALRDPGKLPVPRFVISEYSCYGIRKDAIRTRSYKLLYQQPADREVFMKHVKDPKYLPSVSFDRETFHLFQVLKDPHELNDIWTSRKDEVGARLLRALKEEIENQRPPKRVKQLDPALVEELRSMGYVQ